MASSPVPPTPASATNTIRRPLKDLMTQLCRLPTLSNGEADFPAADPELLLQLADSAEMTLQILHGGFAAIGVLYSYTSQHIEDGEVKATHAAAVGRLLTELGEVLGYAHGVSAACRFYTSDYTR